MSEGYVITFSFWGHLEQNKSVPQDIQLQAHLFEMMDWSDIQSAVRVAVEVLRQCLRLHVLNDKQDMSSLQAVMLCSTNGETQTSF